MSDAVVQDKATVASVAVGDDAKLPQENVAPVVETKEDTSITEAVEIKAEDKVEVKTEEVEEEKASVAPKTQNGESTQHRANARPGREDYKKNRKFDPSTQPVTDDPHKIRAQVEYYFGDSNLPTDKFMWETTGGEANKPMSLKTICSFKRMARFQPYSAVVAALKESKSLEVSGEEGEEVVKRKKAYSSSTEAQKERLTRTVYAKGFGEETKTTQFDVEAFFAEFGPIRRVVLRRDDKDTFKESVFVEFDTEDLAKAFISTSPAPKFNGNELVIKSKRDYIDEKNRLIKEGLMEPSTARLKTFYEGKIKSSDQGRGRGRGNGRGRGRGDQNRDRNRGGEGGDSGDWKKRRENDQKDGFKNSRGGRGHFGSRGRGGGRGRGGRGGDNNRDRNERGQDENRSTNNVTAPTIKSTTDSGAVVKNGETNGKRAREGDDGGSAPPAKKVDVKTEQ
ncbi:hypothetical protein B0T24DRAFT_595901 [Lasiosphaeria ovina]|uniref:RNA-binding La domain protein n=1 Tax=Lasiosphaeria ovina TaxID=92902 RepID=A0AAE0K2Z1_9PEZI|nr:hypothetical protein B0T24DRAFT_595901 [Lasiosphaeria ovina]